MEQNPYIDMMARSSDPDSTALLLEGKVLSLSPLTIQAAEQTYDAKWIKVNPCLVPGTVQTYSAHHVATVQADEHTGTGNCWPNTLTVTKTYLNAGDSVLVATMDQQTLYVICKVVSV